MILLPHETAAIERAVERIRREEKQCGKITLIIENGRITCVRREKVVESELIKA